MSRASHDIGLWTRSQTRAPAEDIFSKRRNLPKLPPPAVGEIWVVLKPGVEIGSQLVRITAAFDIQSGKVHFEKLWGRKTYVPGPGIRKPATWQKGEALLKMFNTRINGFAPKDWVEKALGITIEVPA